MSETLLDDFATFFDGVPDIVRGELSFFLVTLADESRIDLDDGLGYEGAARALFDAQTRIGRIGNLIGAAAIFDVYFSADLGQRFEALGAHPEAANGDKRLARVLSSYADRIGAIEMARQQWQTLRRTTLSPAAIGAALIPPTAPRTKYRNHTKPALPPSASDHRSEPQETRRDQQ